MVSLGCAKNLADSEAMLGQILAARPGAIVCSDPADAEVVVVNTCGFLEAARNEADAVLDSVEKLQRSGRVSRIVAVGCYPQLWREQVLRRHPGVYAILGVDALYQRTFWESLLDETPVRQESGSIDAAMMRGFTAPRLLSEAGSFAYLKIADGCSQKCSYCTIPLIKGPLVSRNRDVILREAEDLVRAGVSELILVSQNTSAYGMDLASTHRPQLASLLRDLDQIGGLKVLRVLYLYPTLVTQELVETIATSRRIAHYVDIPLQHTDPDILRAMGRPWSAGSATALVERVRRAMPDAAIRSTFIVGFPGETEDQFRRLLGDLAALRLDHASAFAYSREPRASSYGLPDQVHGSTKRRRLRQFMEVQQEISASINRERYLGKRVDVIVDGVGQTVMHGRTLLDAPDVDNAVSARFTANKRPIVGSICPVRIRAVGPYDLTGTLV